jgi:glucosamine-6-phosphate deaminase
LSLQYFKDIEQVARAEGFEQILPSKVRTGPASTTATSVPTTIVTDEFPAATIRAPQPTTSRLLRATPATEYPVRSRSPSPDKARREGGRHLGVDGGDNEYTVRRQSRSPSPDLMPDRMASRMEDPAFMGRCTPNPEQQMQRQVPRTSVTA